MPLQFLQDLKNTLSTFCNSQPFEAMDKQTPPSPSGTKAPLKILLWNRVGRWRRMTGPSNDWSRRLAIKSLHIIQSSDLFIVDFLVAVPLACILVAAWNRFLFRRGRATGSILNYIQFGFFQGPPSPRRTKSYFHPLVSIFNDCVAHSRFLWGILKGKSWMRFIIFNDQNTTLYSYEKLFDFLHYKVYIITYFTYLYNKAAKIVM